MVLFIMCLLCKIALFSIFTAHNRFACKILMEWKEVENTPTKAKKKQQHHLKNKWMKKKKRISQKWLWQQTIDSIHSTFRFLVFRISLFYCALVYALCIWHCNLFCKSYSYPEPCWVLSVIGRIHLFWIDDGVNFMYITLHNSILARIWWISFLWIYHLLFSAIFVWNNHDK